MNRKLMMTAMLGLILPGAVAQHAMAGRCEGPAKSTDAVQARSTDVYRICFEAGEIAVIAVTGNGGTDLDLVVFDSENRVVAADTDPTDRCIVFFVPDRTQVFRVEVSNFGNVDNEYTIETN